MAKLKFDPFWPEGAPKPPRFAWGEGAQYKIILHCREAPACLSRPNGVPACR